MNKDYFKEEDRKFKFRLKNRPTLSGWHRSLVVYHISQVFTPYYNKPNCHIKYQRIINSEMGSITYSTFRKKSDNPLANFEKMIFETKVSKLEDLNGGEYFKIFQELYELFPSISKKRYDLVNNDKIIIDVYDYLSNGLMILQLDDEVLLPWLKEEFQDSIEEDVSEDERFSSQFIFNQRLIAEKKKKDLTKSLF